MDQINRKYDALFKAAEEGNLEKLKAEIKKGGTPPPVHARHRRSGRTPVLIAGKKGHMDCVRYLITEANASPFIQDSDNRTILHHLIRSGTPKDETAQKKAYDMFASILEGPGKNFNLALGDKDGMTVLHTAAKYANWDIFQYLYKRNPDLVEICDKAGKKPLHILAEYNYIELLRKWRFELRLNYLSRTKSGDTVAHIAAENGHSRLLDFFIQSHKELFSKKNKRGFSPILSAAAAGQFKLVERIYRLGPTLIAAKDRKKQTLIHHAAIGTKYSEKTKSEYNELLKFLLSKAKYLIGEKSKEGMTALLCAAKHGHCDLMEQIYTGNKELINTTDSAGWNVAHWAINNGHIHILEWLEKNKLSYLINKKIRKGGNALFIALESNDIQNQTNRYQIIHLLAKKHSELNPRKGRFDFLRKTPYIVAKKLAKHSVLYKDIAKLLKQPVEKIEPLNTLFASSHLKTLLQQLEKKTNFLDFVRISKEDFECKTPSSNVANDEYGQYYEGNWNDLEDDDTTIKRPALIKMLNIGPLEEDHALKRLRNEFKALARLRHSNILEMQAYHLDEKSGMGHLIMEPVKKGSLAHLLQNSEKSTHETLPPKTRIFIAKQICDALIFIHQHQVIHRNLTPWSIMITDENYEAKITNFGLAKIDSYTQLTKTTDQALPSVTSLPYQAPEVKSQHSKSTAASDVYSFGKICETLLLEKSVMPSNASQDTKTVTDLAFANIIESCYKIVLGCCAEAPSERATLADIAETLDTLLNSLNEDKSPKTKAAAPPALYNIPEELAEDLEEEEEDDNEDEADSDTVASLLANQGIFDGNASGNLESTKKTMDASAPTAQH